MTVIYDVFVWLRWCLLLANLTTFWFWGFKLDL